MSPAAPPSDGAAASPPDHVDQDDVAHVDQDEVAHVDQDDVAHVDQDDVAHVDQDDAALSWGDADDATHVDAAHNALTTRSPRARDEDAPVGSGALVGFGVFGGIYLLYTVAWLISGSVMSGVTGVAAEVMRVLAIMAPAMWFVVTLWVGQRASNRAKFLWLVIGALALIPWPFILTRSFG
jgi:hypothetical protein